MTQEAQGCSQLRAELHNRIRTGAALSDDEIREYVTQIAKGKHTQSAGPWATFWLDTVVPVCARRPHLAPELLVRPIRMLHSVGVNTVEGAVIDVSNYASDSLDAVECDWLESLETDPAPVHKAWSTVIAELDAEHSAWLKEELSPVSRVPFTRIQISNRRPSGAFWTAQDYVFPAEDTCVWREMRCGIVLFVGEIDNSEMTAFGHITEALSRHDSSAAIDLVVNGLAGSPLFPGDARPTHALWILDGHVTARTAAGELDLEQCCRLTRDLLASCRRRHHTRQDLEDLDGEQPDTH